MPPIAISSSICTPDAHRAKEQPSTKTADFSHLVSILILLRKMKQSNVGIGPITCGVNKGILLKLVSRAVPAYHSNRKPCTGLCTLVDISVGSWNRTSRITSETLTMVLPGRHFLDSDHGYLIQQHLQAALPGFLILYRLSNGQRLQTHPRSEYRHLQSPVLIYRKRDPCHHLPL